MELNDKEKQAISNEIDKQVFASFIVFAVKLLTLIILGSIFYGKRFYKWVKNAPQRKSLRERFLF